MDVLLLVSRLVLAVVFAVAGIAKLLDLPGSRKAAADFGVPARFASLAGLALPVAELAIALLLIPTPTSNWGALGALLLLLTFMAAIGLNLVRGRAPDCHCFGQLHSTPAGPATLTRNGILAAVAAFVLVAGWSDAGTSVADPLGDFSTFEATLLAGGGCILLGLVAGLAWVVDHRSVRNGRRLARRGGRDVALASTTPPPSQAPQPPAGLPVGVPAPDFSLPDLAGNPVSLASLKTDHARLLLLFTDPGCGPCRIVLSLVRQWQAAAGDRLHIEVISRGDHTANVTKAREYGLSRVLLQADREVSQDYATGGTPAAVLIERDGTIGAPMAGGFEAIRDLVASLLGPGSDPSLQAPAPSLKGAAPSFRLPSLAGGEVSLADLLALGRPVMLHFTDPRCGPCYELLPDIGGWQRYYGDRLTSVVVSGGTPDHNRLMTNEYGIAPNLVLLQAKHQLYDAFNLRQMPAAIVIDADGDIRREVGYGADAVRKLMADALGLRLPDRPASAVKAAAVGDTAPVFRRPDLLGIPHEVGVPRAGGTVLLFWNPGCPHCDGLVPEVREWETHPDAPQVVVVSRGPQALNRELGFTSPIVLDDDRTLAQSYGATGTPAAVVIDAQGMIASAVGRGATGVRALLTQTIGSTGVNRDRSMPDGPVAGLVDPAAAGADVA